MESNEMRTSLVSSPQEGHVVLKRFLEGEHVEVRQQEKGLRGSWHPAVVIGANVGRRVVEYDELLTEDGREKLIEHISVGRCRDGGGAISTSQPWMPPAKRSCLLLRPRPPPLPEPSSISWSRGLLVDCYSQDAWWEGVLTEAISSSSRSKRAVVWFPEEEDWEAMLLKDMRVGQQWDEETGKWSLKGCVDIPDPRLGRRGRSMSLGCKEANGKVKCQLRSSTHGLELATGLQGIEADYTSSWTTTINKLEDVNAEISVQLYSPRESGDSKNLSKSMEGAGTRRCLELLSGGSVVAPLKMVDSFCSTGLTSISGCNRKHFLSSRSSVVGKNGCQSTSSAVQRVLEGGSVDCCQTQHRGETLDPRHLAVEVQGMARTRKDVETGHGEVDDDCRRLLQDTGWSISRTRRKNGKFRWYYRSPDGCLLDSLASAMVMWKQSSVAKGRSSSDDENPTLSDMKSSALGRGSKSGKYHSGNERIFKECRRVESPEGREEGGKETKLTLAENIALQISTRSPVQRDVLLASTSNCRRNVLANDIAGNHVDWSEMKRRKIRGPSAGQSDSSGLRVSLSCAKATEGAGGFAAVGIAARKKVVTQSKQVDLANTFYLNDDNVDIRMSQRSRKKRRCPAEEVKSDESIDIANTKSVENSSPILDRTSEIEPSSKKRRVISGEPSSPSEGRNRKCLAILQESSPEKSSFPDKGFDVKQVNTSGNQVKKSTPHAKKGRRSRGPARGVRLEVLLSSPGINRDSVLGEGELTRKRTLLSWLIDNGKVIEREKVRYLHRKDLHCMLEGFVTRDGILCNCCNKVVTLSVFEAHAGSKLHRPSANIFLDSGRSLSICQVEALAVKTQNESDSQHVLVNDGCTVDKSDDTCGFCGDGGVLILCDHCPSTYHLSCMGLQEIPEGDWYCPNCRCGSCGGSQFNVDPSTFDDLTVIFCKQCEFDYHVKCLRAQGLVLDSIPKDDTFCGASCKRIFQGLRSLVGVCKGMKDGFSWTLLRSAADDERKNGYVSNVEINAEHDSKLSIALSVMQECFRPMIDPRTKVDIISNVLYNRRSDVSRLNYHGFYTMLLERGDELISVATIRVHGPSLAEMPLIGTRFQYRRQGMCRRLLGALEEMLRTLGVDQLVLPAVPDLLDTWINAFGFKPMDQFQRCELMDKNIMAFPETSILYKLLGKAQHGDHKSPPSTVEHSRHSEMSQPGLLKNLLGGLGKSPPLTIKRGRGRPPKSKMEFNHGLGSVAEVATERLATVGYFVQDSDSLASYQTVNVKRGRGRPRKRKVTANSSNEPKASALFGGHELTEAVHDGGFGCSLVTEYVIGKDVAALGLQLCFKDDALEQEIAPQLDVFQRNQGQPPQAREYSQSLPSFGTLSTTATVGVEQVTRLHDGEIVALINSSGSQSMSVMMDLSLSSSDSGRVFDKTSKLSPVSCKAGVKRNGNTDAVMTKVVNPATVKILNSVLGVDADLMHASPGPKDVEMEQNLLIPSQSVSGKQVYPNELKGVEDLSDLAVIRKTCSLKEARAPSWPVSGDAKAMSRTFVTHKRSCRAFRTDADYQTDIPSLGNATSGNRKMYGRRKTKLSTQYQSEPLSRIQRDVSERDFSYKVSTLYEDYDVEPAAVTSFEYKAVSVPIRAFPSQFASRVDNDISTGTYIPVETIVVNTCRSVEPLHDWTTEVVTRSGAMPTWRR